MGAIKEAIRRRLNSYLQGGETVARAKQNLMPALFTLTGANDPEDAKYKRITAPQMRRDLNPLMQERMQAVCYYLKVTNPFAKRIVEVITSYVVGEGFKAIAADERVQEVIDQFWRDPVNDMDRQMRNWSDELATFGELTIPVAVTPVSGRVRCGYVDPLDVESIRYAALQADQELQFLSRPAAIVLKQRVGEAQRRELQIIAPDEDPNSETYGRLSGECFYFTINKAKGGTRGFSDLFALADWADVFDAAVFDSADRVRFLNAYVWHYVLKGADEKTVEEFKKKVTQAPPKQGGVQVTNEQVEINAVTPDLKGADLSAALTMVRNYGLGGAGLPTWFFADGSQTNKSTADEMTGPTGKKLTDRQNELKSAGTTVLDFVLDQAQQAGVLPEGIDKSYEWQVPDLFIKDISKAATTMGALTNSLSIAEQNGWVRSETAARAFYAVLSQIGVDVDEAEEFKQAQAEMQTRLAQQINAFAPQRSLALDLANADKTQAGAPVSAGVVQ